jgi:hypothetical protein
MGQGGFADTGQIFYQQMTAGKETGQCQTDCMFLAKDDAIGRRDDRIDLLISMGNQQFLWRSVHDLSIDRQGMDKLQNHRIFTLLPEQGRSDRVL